jgi:protein-disulfide isomerase
MHRGAIPLSHLILEAIARNHIRGETMKHTFAKYFGIVSLLAVLTLALDLPVAVSAQRPARITAEAQRHILHEPGAPVLGSANASVTVVEYFDYNCPFCRALAPVFREFIDKDRASAVLYKEWPVFGGVSVYAAQSALAANYQDKYLQAHDALISAPRLEGTSQVDAALHSAGIDMDQLKKDLVAHRESIDRLLMRNDAEARTLGFRGTPGVLVGRRTVSGVSDLAALQSAVALSHRAGADR